MSGPEPPIRAGLAFKPHPLAMAPADVHGACVHDSPIRPEFDPDLVETGLAEEESGCELTLSLATKDQPTASKNKNHLSYEYGHYQCD
jgi:hypothetical protein